MERLSTSFDDDREGKDSESAHEEPLEKYLNALSQSTSQLILNDPKNLRDVLLERKSKSMPAKKCINRIGVLENKRRLLFDGDRIPKYKDYQLLGDSQFVRFAEQILGIRSFLPLTIGSKSRYIGHCVSGQKIEDLECRLSNNNYEVHSKVLMMIGTNDLIQKTDMCRMLEHYTILLDKLIEKCSKIVLLTVPPVPKLVKNEPHWCTLRTFNTFIQNKANNRQIFVIDVCTLFVTYNNSVTFDYFERMFHPSDRLDLIHLNQKGLLIMRQALDTYYFGVEERNRF